jgi:glycosyltransferase involved in cell wall biosynthesis
MDTPILMRESRTALSDAQGAARPGPEPGPEPARITGPLDALYVLNALGIGGSERKTVRLVNRLRKRGVNAAIAYLNGPEDLAAALDADVPRWHLHRRGKFSLPALQRLGAIIRAHRPRMVFAVNLYPSLYVAAAARAVGERAVTIGALVNTTQFASHDRLRKALYRPLLGRFDSVIYGCETQRRAWLHPSDRAWRRTTIVYNGVDTREFDPCDALPWMLPAHWREAGEQPFVIGAIGRMSADKNQQALIESVFRLRAQGVDARLLLIGDGPLRSALWRQARERGIERAVEMPGTFQDVRPALAAMDVFVLPSLHVETFSNAALEAMAMCRPVVLSDIGGAREMVRDGVDGHVIALEELPARLPWLLGQLAADAQLRARMGAEARRRVESRFSFESMLHRYEQVIARANHDHAG